MSESNNLLKNKNTESETKLNTDTFSGLIKLPILKHTKRPTTKEPNDNTETASCVIDPSSVEKETNSLYPDLKSLDEDFSNKDTPRLFDNNKDIRIQGTSGDKEEVNKLSLFEELSLTDKKFILKLSDHKNQSTQELIKNEITKEVTPFSLPLLNSVKIENTTLFTPRQFVEESTATLKKHIDDKIKLFNDDILTKEKDNSSKHLKHNISESQKYINTTNYYKNSDTILFNTFHDQFNSYIYTTEDKEFRNNILFNLNHERFILNTLSDESYKFDPWVFEKDENSTWPSYVNYLYYTKYTPGNEIVRLSKPINLYLNLCFNKQSFAGLYKIGYHVLYQEMSKTHSSISTDYIKNNFINKEKINACENLEIVYLNEQNLNSERLIVQRGFIDINKHLTRIPIYKTQPTDWQYKSLYDFIPICLTAPYYSVYPEIEPSYYNPRTLVTTDVCFHNDNCHNHRCTTHNTSMYRLPISNKYPHDKNQELYKFKQNQIITLESLL